MTQDAGGKPAIVVGTDGSASATEAVKRAAQIAFSRGASLHIVHGFPRAGRYEIKTAQRHFQREIGYSQMGRFDVDGIGDSATIAQAILEDAAHSIDLPGVPVFLHPVNMDPHKALRFVAIDKGAQMIVVGNKPQQSLRVFRKAVAKAIQENAPCPVQVVDTSAFWRIKTLPTGARRGEISAAPAA